MAENREIITKVVVGRRIQTFRKIVRITSGKKNYIILGCTVCGGKVLGSCVERDAESTKIRAKIRFDMHIWYRLDNDTNVAKMSTECTQSIAIKDQGSQALCLEEAHVWIKEKPKCIEIIQITNSERNKIAVQIEYALGAEIIGETVLNVKVFET